MKSSKYLNLTLILLIGVLMGWFVGLSTSQLAPIIITSLIALVVSLLSILIGTQDSPEKAEKKRLMISVDRVKPVFLFLFMLGIAAGAPAGIYVRTNDFLGVGTDNFVKRWKGTGLPEKEIQQRLFNTLYPKDKANSDVVKQSTGGLFSSEVTADACTIIRSKKGVDLRAELELLNDVRVTKALTYCKDDECLNSIRAMLCEE